MFENVEQRNMTDETEERERRSACLNQQRSHIWTRPTATTSSFHITAFITSALKTLFMSHAWSRDDKTHKVRVGLVNIPLRKLHPHFSYIQLANKAVEPSPRAGLMDQPTFSQQAELTQPFFLSSPLLFWKNGEKKLWGCWKKTGLAMYDKFTVPE